MHDKLTACVSQTKEIVIISPPFAPFSGVGAVRMTSLSRYLTSKGYHVTVFRNSLDYWNQKELQASVPADVALIDVKVDPSKRDNFNAQIYKCALDKYLSSNRCDLLLASVGPFYAMFFMANIYKKHKIPYIIDYRDPWLWYTYSDNNNRLKAFVKNVILMPVEYRCLRYASAIVNVTDACTNTLIRSHPTFRRKYHTIMNGYIDEQFELGPKADKFTIAIAGKISEYNAKDISDIFNGMEDAQKEANVTIRFLHIGVPDNTVQKLLSERNYSIDYQECGVLSYKECLSKLASTDVCLVVHNKSEHVGLGTKIFDYIYMDKPIICYCNKKSELARFCNDFSFAYICDSQSDIKNALNEILTKNITNLGVKNTRQYSRAFCCEQYEKLLSGIISDTVISN